MRLDRLDGARLVENAEGVALRLEDDTGRLDAESGGGRGLVSPGGAGQWKEVVTMYSSWTRSCSSYWPIWFAPLPTSDASRMSFEKTVT